MKFGKYAILQPVTYHFRKEPDLWWKFRPPTSGDELEMARYLNRGKLTLSVEGPSREVPPSWIEVAHREIALIFAGTNMVQEENQTLEEGGTVILTKDQEVEEIEAMLRLMPHAMVMEIWSAMGEHVPGWGGPPLDPEEEEGEIPNSESREEEVPSS